ncbi:MAG: hypothetical protein CM15mV144_040 [Caudoviricetes sp.]|nr:MAG: hypothetical protein CM15mV144_040 [Caudoviricetes sp.]
MCVIAKILRHAFPADHKIKMKYAPFSVQDNHWVMKRPEGILPIFVSDKRPEDYVVINEGEKAMRGAEAIWKAMYVVGMVAYLIGINAIGLP